MSGQLDTSGVDWKSPAIIEERERMQAQATIADLHQRLSDSHREKQRLIHENERLREQVKHEVIAATESWALEFPCAGRCGTPPLRIKVAPPDDAIDLWVSGYGWKTAEDGTHWCQGCGGDK